jgi:hypothetical protein
VVALDAEGREPESGARKRPFFEVFVVIVAALALVVGLYAFGNALGDDDTNGVAATASAPANAAASGAQAAAADASVHSHDEAGAAVDDRGFAALANGEQHAHSFTQPISPADRVELARQLTLARQVALQYPTVKDAEAAGLHRAGPFSPGLGAHYINYGNALGNTDGKMTDDAIRKPLAWIYDGTKPDSHIAGLFYMTSNADPPGFAGSNDTWHVHHDICIKPAANGTVDAPLGADHDATKAQCDAVGGNLLKQTQYLLHVWVVPGYESPEGVFSHLSSAVTCDDGSYQTIDVTKTGGSTTICADGTE